MATPGPDYYETLWGRAVDPWPGGADWWAMMDDRYARAVRMLDHARELGIPITGIEFGNEYYFAQGEVGNCTHGATANPYADQCCPSGSANFVGAFPDDDTPIDPDPDPDYGRSYADAINYWAPRLTAPYPGATLIAQASLNYPGRGSQRESHWNRDVLTRIDPAWVDGFAVHVYGPTQAGNVVSTEAAFGLALSIWLDSWNTRASASALPNGKQMWVTEYNSNQDPKTWGNGLLSLFQVLTWIEDRADKGGLGATNYHLFRHYILDQGGPAITATGRALSLLALATKRQTRAVRKALAGSPDLAGSGGLPAVQAWAFDRGPGTPADHLLVNFSGSTLDFDTASLGVAGGTPYRRASAPLSTATADPGETEGAVASPLPLPPFSISVLRGRASAPAATSGEATGLRVARFDPATGRMTLEYEPGCGAYAHTIAFGELTRTNVRDANWSGRECAIGRSGLYAWDTSSLPASLFFVVVARDAAAEGSYGANSAGAERPPVSALTACDLPQDLARRCDTP